MFNWHANFSFTFVVVDMFRGFIPGKRVASVDLSAARDEGKENRDPSRTMGKADHVKNNAKADGADSNEMVQAFDKLLVRFTLLLNH